MGPIGSSRLAVNEGDGSMRLYIVSSFDAFASSVGDGYKEAARSLPSSRSYSKILNLLAIPGTMV